MGKRRRSLTHFICGNADCRGINMVIFYPEPGEIDSVKGKKNCFFGQCLSKPRKQPAFAGVRPSLLHFFIALKKQVNMMIKELQSRIRFF